MKALVYTAPGALDYCQVAMPVPASDEALVRVEAAGICGSDMHAFVGHDARRPAPLILGHEASGTLEDGTRVTINPLVSCGTCDNCGTGRENICHERQIISMPPREGAFAEYVSVPRTNLTLIPDGISFDKAALTEPLACGWHGVRLGLQALAKDPGATSCAVLGGGAIGLGAALALAARGAGDIWIGETNGMRRRVLERLTLFHLFNPSGHGAPGMGTVDLVVDGVGVEATRAMASRIARPGGVIVHIGLGTSTGGLDIRRMTLQEITFIGAYTYTTTDFAETAQAIFAGKLGSLDWIETRPLSHGADAFADLRAGQVAVPKIILVP